MRILRSILALTLLLGLASCDYTEPRRIVAGVDLDALFAPPSQGEITAVLADWASRDTGADGVRLEAVRSITEDEETTQILIVSHLVDGLRHVGAVIYPDGAAAASLPVLVYLHGGDGGVSVDDEVLLIAEAFNSVAGDFVLVVPSFRDETVRFGGSSWKSDGPPSPWDRDVDDTMALLSVALDLVPSADPERVGVVGFSRGAGVGLLMGIRDERVDRVVEFFGPTDFFGPFVQDVVEEILLGSPRSLPGLDFLSGEYVLPLSQGTVPMAAARIELVRRSAVLFADRLPPVQLHHGTADAVVPVSQAQSLIRTMEQLGRTDTEFEPFVYEGGGHNPLTLEDSFARALAFLAPLSNGP